jgi:hypothetical protein
VLLDGLQPDLVVVEHRPKMVVAFGDDSHRGFDPLDHHIEVATHRLVLLAETSIESFLDAIEPFVYASEPFVDTSEPFVHPIEPFVDPIEPFVHPIEPFVDANESFVDANESFVDANESLVDIPEALGNVPAQILDRHERLHPTIVTGTCRSRAWSLRDGIAKGKRDAPDR